MFVIKVSPESRFDLQALNEDFVFKPGVADVYQGRAIRTAKLNAPVVFQNIAAEGKKIFATLRAGNRN